MGREVQLVPLLACASEGHVAGTYSVFHGLLTTLSGMQVWKLELHSRLPQAKDGFVFLRILLREVLKALQTLM